MSPATKKLVLQALSNLRGDDYERAQAAFRHLTPAQMQALAVFLQTGRVQSKRRLRKSTRHNAALTEEVEKMITVKLPNGNLTRASLRSDSNGAYVRREGKIVSGSLNYDTSIPTFTPKGINAGLVETSTTV